MVPTTSGRSEVKGYDNSASFKKVIDYSDKVVNVKITRLIFRGIIKSSMCP